jgi:formate hydrogenlyase subunit 4
MNDFLLYAAINLTLIVILSPLYISLIKKVKAWMQGRKGPVLFQTYYNLFKLFKKESVYSTNSSAIMRISPYINLLFTVIAALFVPLLFIPNNYFGFGNIILFLYLLALGKFFIALGGLDAGSTFGGMGSSREMSISSIVEPTVIAIFAALSFLFKSTNLFDIFNTISHGQNQLFTVLLLIPLMIVLLTECARIPVDNPETHLELTMVHEAMVLEQSGKNLAMIELASAIKQILFMGIIINLFLPFGFNGFNVFGYSSASFGLPATMLITLLIALLAFLIKSVLLACVIGVIESYLAKARLFRLPNLFAISLFLSLITIIMGVLL